LVNNPPNNPPGIKLRLLRVGNNGRRAGTRNPSQIKTTPDKHVQNKVPDPVINQPNDPPTPILPATAQPCDDLGDDPPYSLLNQAKNNPQGHNAPFGRQNSDQLL